MRRLFLLLPAFLCLAGCSALTTQGGAGESSGVPLAQANAPAFAKALSAPSRGRLMLSYSAPTGSSGEGVWLLLFEREIPAKDRPLNTRFKDYVGSHGPVTLLVVAPNPTIPKGWSIINTIPLGIVRKEHKDYIALRWLEPHKQKGPVLIVNKLGGVGGSSELIAFPTGWNHRAPVRQTYGDWMRWDDGAKYDFHSIDSKGFLCITETYTSYAHEPRSETSEKKYHLWNGSGWK